MQIIKQPVVKMIISGIDEFREWANALLETCEKLETLLNNLPQVGIISEVLLEEMDANDAEQRWHRKAPKEKLRY